MTDVLLGAEAPIDEIVGWLSQFAPRRLEELRERFPDHGLLLRPGMVAGGPADALSIRVSASLELLNAASTAADAAVARINARLKRAKMWRDAADILVVIASSALVANLATGSTTVTLVAALCNFVGVLGPHAADHLNTPIHKNAGDLFTTYQSLVTCTNEVTSRRPLLQSCIGQPSRECAAIIGEVNTLAGRMRILMSQLP